MCSSTPAYYYYLCAGLLILCAVNVPLLYHHHAAADDPVPRGLGGKQLMAVSERQHAHAIVGVVDGDTLIITAPFLPPPLRPQLLLRIHGVDTPEKGWRAQCKSEEQQAEVARQFMEQCIHNETQTYTVVLRKWDKYGGRVLGDVYFEPSQTHLSALLVQRGVAVLYTGTGVRHNWCAAATD